MTDAPSEGLPDVRLLHLNPPMMPPAILSLGPLNYRRAFNVGCWAWELEVLPPEWVKALRYVNAVIVPSSFTKAAVERYTDKPVAVVPHPIRLGLVERGLRARLGIPEEAFLVSTIFSYGSSFGRKNPMAVVEAFRKAFEGNPAAFLVVKTSHGAAHQVERGLIKQAAGTSDRIIMLDETWPAERVSALIEASNAYVSLHRSEGFGLTIGEAILRDVPVVTTAWSGNLDFCRPEESYLVRAKLIPVDDNYPEFRILGGAYWADPSVDEAAAQLRHIFSHKIEAKRRASSARAFMIEYLATRPYETALVELQAHNSESEFVLAKNHLR